MDFNLIFEDKYLKINYYFQAKVSFLQNLVKTPEVAYLSFLISMISISRPAAKFFQMIEVRTTSTNNKRNNRRTRKIKKQTNTNNRLIANLFSKRILHFCSLSKIYFEFLHKDFFTIVILFFIPGNW